MRLDYIDITKGIGIILVVLFHTPNIGELCFVENFYWGGYITTFYMPLFFLLSGIFFKVTSILTRIKRLLIPYFSFVTIGGITYISKCITTDNTIDWNKIYAPFLGATKDYPNTPCWFLLSLIIISITYFYISNFIKNKTVRITLSFILSTIGFYIGKFWDYIPYYIDVSLLCNIFFAFGYEYRNFILNIKELKIVIGLIILSFIIYSKYPYVTNISQNIIPYNILIFYLLSFTSSLGLIGLSKYIQYSKAGDFFAFLGRNSLIILCTHILLIPLGGILWNMNLLYMNIIGTLLIILVEIPIIKLINSRFSFMLGN